MLITPSIPSTLVEDVAGAAKKVELAAGDLPIGTQVNYMASVPVLLSLKLGQWVTARDAGVIGDGVADDTAAMQKLAGWLEGDAGLKCVSGMQGLYIKLTGPVTMRASDKVFDCTGAVVLLGSSTAGFRFAGNRGTIKGARFEQTSQTFTPTALYIFNDATTTSSNYWRVLNCTSYSVYRALHFYMGNVASSAYRHTVIDCEFMNFHSQKTWSGSFGICFDGIGLGNSAGNDSKVTNTFVKGYEKNYVVNNSVCTSFINCSGDGAADCFQYAGNSSGLRIIGGYYEYNDYFMEIAGGDKYDAYISYPSIANTVNTLLRGGAVTFLSGGFAVGTGGTPPSIKNGAFQTNGDGSSEIYANNGLSIFSNGTKALRASVNSAGAWLFETVVSLKSLLNVDTIKGYTGGSTPLKIWTTSGSAGTRLVLGTNSVEHVEIPLGGNLQPVTDSAIPLGASSKRWTDVFTLGLTLTPGTAPASATATGRAGEIRIVSGFIYVCIATNTWQRSALDTW